MGKVPPAGMAMGVDIWVKDDACAPVMAPIWMMGEGVAPWLVRVRVRLTEWPTSTSPKSSG